MYDINLKNVKKQKGFNLVFILAGLLFLVIIGGVIVGTFVKESKMDASVMSSADLSAYPHTHQFPHRFPALPPSKAIDGISAYTSSSQPASRDPQASDQPVSEAAC